MPGATLLRQLKPADVKCAAGDLTGDANVHCRIEDHTLIGPLEPHAIEGFCCGDYQACPSWMASKKVEEHGGDLRRILSAMQDANARRRQTLALREARLRKAQRLMAEDSPEGKAFRRKLLIGEFEHLRDMVAEGDR